MLEFIDRYFYICFKIKYIQMHIDHIAIWTDNIETEKDFFLKYFECIANRMYTNTVKKFSSYFITFDGGAKIEIMKRADITTERTGETLGITHIAINAGSREKVDKLTELLEQDGYTIVSRPRVTGDGYYESAILDPEKNVIEIMYR
jgi:lactoylglutathione lyase